MLGWRRLASWLLISVLAAAGLAGCQAFNPGKFKGIERTDPDEKHYLLKKIALTAGSTAHSRTNFDHTMQESVNVVFTPANELNDYVTKTVWYDPSGLEFRTIQQTHVLRDEQDKGRDRPKGGTQRIHSIPLIDLYKHKPGLWKVELFINGQLARRLKFTVN